MGRLNVNSVEFGELNQVIVFFMSRLLNLIFPGKKQMPKLIENTEKAKKKLTGEVSLEVEDRKEKERFGARAVADVICSRS